MATSKKSNEAAGEAIAWILAIIAFLPFIVVSVLKFKEIEKDYLQGDNVRRVVDIKTITKPLGMFSGLALFGYIFASKAYESNKLVAIMLICFVVFIAIHLAKWVAVKYVGAIIDEERDLVVFPPDMQSYVVSDYFKFKFLKDMTQVETVKISSIEKMTRQAGKHLYLQGVFGSRKISFSNKQKRDECMSAIQQAAGKKSILMYELEQSGYA